MPMTSTSSNSLVYVRVFLQLITAYEQQLRATSNIYFTNKK